MHIHNTYIIHIKHCTSYCLQNSTGNKTLKTIPKLYKSVLSLVKIGNRFLKVVEEKCNKEK